MVSQRQSTSPQRGYETIALLTRSADILLQLFDLRERGVLAARAQQIAQRLEGNTTGAALVEEGEGFLVVRRGLLIAVGMVRRGFSRGHGGSLGVVFWVVIAGKMQGSKAGEEEQRQVEQKRKNKGRRRVLICVCLSVCCCDLDLFVAVAAGDHHLITSQSSCSNLPGKLNHGTSQASHEAQQSQTTADTGTLSRRRKGQRDTKKERHWLDKDLPL